jgi:hypothetical protein
MGTMTRRRGKKTVERGATRLSKEMVTWESCKTRTDARHKSRIRIQVLEG